MFIQKGVYNMTIILFVDVTEKMWRLMIPHNACECWCCQCTMSMHRLFLWTSEISYIIVVCLFSVPGSRRRCISGICVIVVCCYNLSSPPDCLMMFVCACTCYHVLCCCVIHFSPNLHVMYLNCSRRQFCGARFWILLPFCVSYTMYRKMVPNT